MNAGISFAQGHMNGVEYGPGQCVSSFGVITVRDAGLTPGAGQTTAPGAGNIPPTVVQYPIQSASGAALTVRTISSGPQLPASSLSCPLTTCLIPKLEPAHFLRGGLRFCIWWTAF